MTKRYVVHLGPHQLVEASDNKKGRMTTMIMKMTMMFTLGSTSLRKLSQRVGDNTWTADPQTLTWLDKHDYPGFDGVNFFQLLKSLLSI